MPISLISALISAGGLVLGSVIGAICSWSITRISIREQIQIKKESLEYQQRINNKERYINANIIRLDICTAIYQSIRCLQNFDDPVTISSMTMFKDYHKLVASLGDELSLKELSYIYQLYGIIDTTFNYINSVEDIYLDSRISIRNSLKNILKKVYGENYIKIISVNIDKVSYETLYADCLMKAGYRDVLSKLDDMCSLDYIKK